MPEVIKRSDHRTRGSLLRSLLLPQDDPADLVPMTPNFISPLMVSRGFI